MTCTIELQTSGPFSPGKTINAKLLCLFDTSEIIEGIIKDLSKKIVFIVNFLGIKCSLVGEERTQFNGEDDTKHEGLESFLKDDIEIIQASKFFILFSL